jgi:large subunit ribosomal protein L24
MGTKFKVRKGDSVVAISGREKGREGTILRVFTKENRVLVQGLNMVKRHQRPSPQHPGGIIEKEAPIHVSNVALIDPQSRKPTRVGYKVLGDGRKVRVARRSGEVIDK